MKRAIALGGGGPAAGLHIGVLKYLEEQGIEFKVWALSCIGAWVGIVYNQADEGKKAKQTYDFFRNGVFRDDRSYDGFPINTVFGTNWFALAKAYSDFMTDPKNYGFGNRFFLPDKIAESMQETMKFITDTDQHNIGDTNRWFLNHVLAVNPFVRYWTSMMFLSGTNGLSRIDYPDSKFMNLINFDRLYRDDESDKDENKVPHIIHNAWNLTEKRLELFSNKYLDYNKAFKEGNYNKAFEDTRDYEMIKPITSTSLCACSALPFVEETVEIDGDTYCEGALVDTVNFRNLLKFHSDLGEVWISRIVDSNQIVEPKNLHDSLANLCQLFAATVGEDDVKLFEQYVKTSNDWCGTAIEIEVSGGINFEWTHDNLDNGVIAGYDAAKKAHEKYLEVKACMDQMQTQPAQAVFIKPSKSVDDMLSEMSLT